MAQNPPENPNSISLRRIEGVTLTESNIQEYLPRGQTNLNQIKGIVGEILEDVKTFGDSAIKKYTDKFDGIDINHLSLEVGEDEIENAFNRIDPKLIDALKAAKVNIETFHQSQLREEKFVQTEIGVQTGQIMRPISRVGLYVPGGKAVYPSSVLMEAIPAKVAGVKELVICSPPQKGGGVAPAILVAARICGVDQVFRCGGAQAIAAMAYGTEMIQPVQKIVGPGNKWVAAAKQLVSSTCGIDNPAGPSEILLVVDASSNPKWAALDLIAQCEHGPDNVPVLLSEFPEKIQEILRELKELVTLSERKDILMFNFEKYGLVIDSMNHQETIRLINLIATEHLHLSVREPREWLPEIFNAGAIFLGEYSPVPLGDYCAGTNHVLPTAGYARMYSGLSVLDFQKAIDVLEVTPEGLNRLYPTLKEIAEYEGLTGHRNCVSERTQRE